MKDDTSRLRWRCRRGKLELDFDLQSLLGTSFSSLRADDQALFELLLELPDPDLCAYLLRRDEPKNHETKLAVNLVLSHTDS
mgnify:CR=1 FL=1